MAEIVFPDTDCTDVGSGGSDQTNDWILNRAQCIPPHNAANLFEDIHLGSFATGVFADNRNGGNFVSMRTITVIRIDIDGNLYEGETVPFFYDARKKTGRKGIPVLQGVYSPNADQAWSLVAYESALLAQKLTNVDHSGICNVCKEKDQCYTAGTSAHGLRFFWEYIEQPQAPPPAPSVFDGYFQPKSTGPKESGPSSSSSSSSLPPAVAGAGGVMMCSIV